MIRIGVITLLFISLLSGETKEELATKYSLGEYQDVCLAGAKMLRDERDDEPFINMVAQACLKNDFIDLLADPIRYLRKTRTSRQNAAYYATLLMQKKLLYHALYDDVDISNISLPVIDHPLSAVFDLFTQKKYTMEGDTYVMEQEGSSYKMRFLRTSPYHKIEIKVYDDHNNFKSIHTYW